MQRGRNARYWNEFKVGEVIETAGRTVESGDVSLFAGLSGDFNPVHINELHAKKSQFGTSHCARTSYPRDHIGSDERHGSFRGNDDRLSWLGQGSLLKSSQVWRHGPDDGHDHRSPAER